MYKFCMRALLILRQILSKIVFHFELVIDFEGTLKLVFRSEIFLLDFLLSSMPALKKI